MTWLGYRDEDSTIEVWFTTHAAAGGAVAPSDAFEAADVRIYKNGSATEKTSANGLTMTSPFDTITGLHLLQIDTSNDTGDAGFWTAGGRYAVVLSPDTETVDSQSVVKVLAEFILGPAKTQLANGVTHGGTSALLRLGASGATPALYVTNSGGDAVQLESTGGDGRGLDVIGNGTAAGVFVQGGATGTGLHVQGGSTKGAAVIFVAAGGTTPTYLSSGGHGMFVSGVSNPGFQSSGAFTADITGNLSGSVGSVTAVVSSDVTQINSSSAAAVRLSLSAGQIIPGTVDDTVAPTTTEFEAADITEATADHYKGRVVLFTSGALAGQATDITAYSLNGGRGHLTVTALTEAPANGDTFIIV